MKTVLKIAAVGAVLLLVRNIYGGDRVNPVGGTSGGVTSGGGSVAARTGGIVSKTPVSVSRSGVEYSGGISSAEAGFAQSTPTGTVAGLVGFLGNVASAVSGPVGKGISIVSNIVQSLPVASQSDPAEIGLQGFDALTGTAFGAPGLAAGGFIGVDAQAVPGEIGTVGNVPGLASFTDTPAFNGFGFTGFGTGFDTPAPPSTSDAPAGIDGGESASGDAASGDSGGSSSGGTE